MKNAINCSVSNCKHHEPTNQCTLSSVTIGTHESNPSKEQCTDCLSYSCR